MSGQRIRVVRADDLLVCELELLGIEVVGSVPNRRLTPDSSGADPTVVVHLPPQHVAEEAFDETEPPQERVLAGSRAAGPSRVAFPIDPAAFPVEYKLPAILELLAAHPLAVSRTAARSPATGSWLGLLAALPYLLNPPGLSNPGPAETAIELPFRLILSPEGDAGFSHMAEPVPGQGSTRVELWHSQLDPAPGQAGQREVRAIWLRRGDGLAWDPAQPKWPAAPAPTGDTEPFELNSMSQKDRADIVHVSGNRRYALQTGTAYEPEPVAVRRLALSSLGAWLDSRGDWDPPKAFTSLVEWTHRATQGRDQFVRIVNVGFLYPFGHLAAKIKITERKFTQLPGDPPILLQRQFIVVRKPLKAFPPGAAPAKQWHTMPLREVQLRTLVTPNLKVPTDAEGGDSCFLIVPAGQVDPFVFKLTGTDAEANKLDLATPLVWVVSTEGWNPATIAKAQTLYDAAKGHVLAAQGAALALGPGPLGDATYAAEALVFSAPPQPPMPLPTGPPADNQPAFWPKLVRAEVRAPALDIVAGVGETAEISYHESYELHGFGGENRNEVIAKLANRLDLDFGDKGDRAGGLIKPSMGVEGLSRQLGPVGGAAAKLGEVAAGKFDPASFFAGMQAKLFGVFTLDQVLAVITGTKPSDLPRIVTEGGGDALVARQVWNPVPQSYPPDKPVFVVDGSTTMEVVATIDARSPSQPRSDVRATLRQFRIHLLGDPTFLELDFEKVEFAAEAGRKPDVDVVMGEIRFVGPLSFVEEIKSLIPLDGFSDPPALEVTPSGIRSSFSLSLPDLAVGVFSLQNLSLGAGFAIPFTDGALTVSFNFCTREEPFLLTVSLFGGGGFFGLSIDPNGVQMLEAALEFGASVAINLGVAQGGVHVMAGIYFKIESGKGCTLTGYFRLGGNMSVLGLISASIELNLSFTYKDPGKAIGRAVVTIEIDIFLFSISVEVECERQFAGSDSDPDFAALMESYEDDAGETVRPWHDYCEAYA